VSGVPDLFSRMRETFFRRSNSSRVPNMRRSTDEEAQESERATAFLDSVSGRFWIAGVVDSEPPDPPEEGSRAPVKPKLKESLTADSIGASQLAVFFERRPGADRVGFLTTLVDTLVPTSLRDPLRIASVLVYRSIARDDGVLEIVARESDRVGRETVEQMAGASPAPPAGAPAEAFFVRRAPTGGRLAGDVYATRVGSGIELVFRPAVP
jgi:hypothetical protein